MSDWYEQRIEKYEEFMEMEVDERVAFVTNCLDKYGVEYPAPPKPWSVKQALKLHHKNLQDQSEYDKDHYKYTFDEPSLIAILEVLFPNSRFSHDADCFGAYEEGEKEQTYISIILEYAKYCNLDLKQEQINISLDDDQSRLTVKFSFNQKNYTWRYDADSSYLDEQLYQDLEELGQNNQVKLSILDSNEDMICGGFLLPKPVVDELEDYAPIEY